MRREKRRRDRLAAESGLLKEEQDRLGRELAQLDVTDMGCHTSDPQCKVEFQYFFRSFESFEEWTRLVIISKRFILRTIGVDRATDRLSTDMYEPDHIILLSWFNLPKPDRSRYV